MFQRLLTFLFPPECLLCKTEGSLLCETCYGNIPSIPFQVSSHTWALLHYHDQPSQQVVFSLKFAGKTELSRTVARLLLPSISHISNHADMVIVPIPSSPKEKNSRGYDHIALIAKELSVMSRIPVSNALIKIRETERQVATKSRKDRLTNLRNAFHFSQQADTQGKVIILIDDVTTTGATFEEARKTLLQGNPKEIFCLALCH